MQLYIYSIRLSPKPEPIPVPMSDCALIRLIVKISNKAAFHQAGTIIDDYNQLQGVAVESREHRFAHPFMAYLSLYSSYAVRTMYSGEI